MNENLKFMIKALKPIVVALLVMTSYAVGQDTAPPKRIKVDGVVAVIGDYVILESDIDKLSIDLENQGVSKQEITNCQLMGKLMEDRLYAHHAIQDSLLVADDQVNAMIENQVQQLTAQVGSIEKVLKFYKKPDLQSFKDELFEINKLRMLADKMRNDIITDIEVTPEEVRQFFYSIPEEERPIFGAELEISQIVKQPKPTEEDKQKVIQRLEQIKQDVEISGSSFSVKAILYSQDPGSKSNGGAYTMDKQTPFVKEFKDVAFSLKEGEISEPFETDFGFHIILVERIRGQEVDLRHILIAPEIDNDAVERAKSQLDSVRTEIAANRLDFAEAARLFSDEKETKFDGGVLRNPADFSARFELTKMDPTLYNQISRLKEGEISYPIVERDPQGGPSKYKIMKVTNRYDEHKADFAKDYMKIQELALSDKQLKTIEEWIDERIQDTFIQINESKADCDFANNWVKE
ncbi:MAG: peptidylprolyl isomerase [Flavobacteriaceae bacterium]|nr:peptidylprolyl isomerase [Flavobacteriaceae bacterium]OUX40114.1 MAG: peptidylprolyl isomerase [Flavobacteriaceae bacterium TMED265]